MTTASTMSMLLATHCRRSSGPVSTSTRTSPDEIKTDGRDRLSFGIAAGADLAMAADHGNAGTGTAAKKQKLNRHIRVIAVANRPPPDVRSKKAGRLTQRLECLAYTEDVGGSNPSSPIFRVALDRIASLHAVFPVVFA